MLSNGSTHRLERTSSKRGSSERSGASRAMALLTRVASDGADKFGRKRLDGRTSHHITLQRGEALSASGLPAVRMSPVGNIVLPSTFHFESLDDANERGFSQAGGHVGTFSAHGATLRKRASHREAAFYESARAGRWPVQFLPAFHGRCMVDGVEGIVLQDLTYGMQRPCVMDLKMGFESVEPSERRVFKRLRHAAIDHLTGSKQSGVRLEGMSMYRSLEKRRMKGNRAQSHVVSAYLGVSLQDVLTFFLTDESGVRTDIALRFQAHIEAILHYFTKYNLHHLFIGSSILLIYDNDNSAPHMRWARALQRLHTVSDAKPISPDRLATLTRRTNVDVRMIDFAHTSAMPRGQTRDHGYIQGLQTILTALKAIRAHRTRPIFSIADAAIDAMSKKAASSSSSSPPATFSDMEEDEPVFNFAALYDQCSAVSIDSTE